MSIILKGIDLPRNGDYHHITIYDNGNTYITTSNVLYETDRKDVEAIQIPTPHGRLIDEKEAIRGWCKVCEFNDGTCGKDETICEDKEMCKYAPTILEAEE